ncbi:MAG TPA: PKD domain-containing protein [Candidatus Saccharimonadales bacterium]|nr:PKD domain-containing protein [Candidatus Saccharimonadales bacterium]
MLRLSHHRHTARHLPHHHTSYAALAFVVMLTGVLLLAVTGSVGAATPYAGPEAGSVGLSGRMPGPPPAGAATILEPRSGQRFNITPITVRGTCPKGVIVEIFKNDIFAGATVCSDEGGYELLIDLFPGQNQLVARVFDALNQAGPDSPTVTVFYDEPAAISSQLRPGEQDLLLKSDSAWKGVSPGASISWPVEITGGRIPYAVSWDWGDGVVEPITRTEEGVFSAKHAYAKPGNYVLRVKASDVSGRVAYLQLVAVVNGAIGGASTAASGPLNGKLLLAWPMYGGAVMMLVSFWLGERFQLYRDRRLQPQR